MSSRCRYLAGTIESNDRRNLIVDDGRFTHGFVVSEFTLWPALGAQIGDMSCVLATKANGAVMPMNAEDNRQIAWGYSAASAQGIPIQTVLLPEVIVLEELILLAQFTDFNDGLNYLIKLEPVTISDSQAALVLINNKAQDI